MLRGKSARYASQGDRTLFVRRGPPPAPPVPARAALLAELACSVQLQALQNPPSAGLLANPDRKDRPDGSLCLPLRAAY